MASVAAQQKGQDNRPKKIAVVADSVYPFAKGGKEKRIYDITTRLAARGFDVTVYCMKLWDGPSTIVRDGVAFCAIAPRLALYNGTRRTITPAVIFALCSLKMLWKKFDVADVDHIPHFVLFAMKLVCALKGKPMIATWHEVWGRAYWKEYLGHLGLFAYLVEKWSIMLPDTIISVSEHTTSLLRPLAGKKKIVTVPNGISFSHIAGIAPAAAGADIVFAGRLLSHKNVGVLLRAIAVLARSRPGVTARIIGEGPEKERLIKLSKELLLEENVVFQNFFDTHDELCAFMRASKLFVLPSSREGFGIVALEANACGLPVITVSEPHNAAQELIVKGENGLVVPLSPEALAEGMDALLTNLPSREASLARARPYDWDKLIERVTTLYDENQI